MTATEIIEKMKKGEVKNINGCAVYNRYALYNFGLEDLEKELINSDPVIDTFDPYEISEQVGGRKEDDKNWCVEYYRANIYGDFVDGSDFDTVTAHYANYHIEKGGK